MIDIGIGVSIEKEPSRAAKEAFLLAKSQLQKGNIDLAIAFSTTSLANPTVLKIISNAIGGVPLIGSSGAAIISNQGISKHGLVVLLLKLADGMHFTAACIKNIKGKSGTEVGNELGEKLLYGFENVRRSISLVLSDALIEESSNLINGLQERLGRSFPIVGGSASDNINFLQTQLYFNQELINDGCVGLLLGGRVNFGLGIKHGWKPLGKLHTVTSSKGNIVAAIDGQPAAKLYEEYLGCNLEKIKKELTHISLLYPLGIHIPGEKEYLLRNIISVEPDGSLRVQGTIPTGSPIRLMIGTKEACLNATQEALDEAKRSFSLPEHHKEEIKKFVIVFSSISRHLLLKRDAEKELEIIKHSFGKNTAIIGLYTYGELAPLMAMNYHGQVYLHNQTIAILTIGG